MGPAEDEEGGGLEEEATSGATAQGSKGTGREPAGSSADSTSSQWSEFSSSSWRASLKNTPSTSMTWVAAPRQQPLMQEERRRQDGQWEGTKRIGRATRPQGHEDANAHTRDQGQGKDKDRAGAMGRAAETKPVTSRALKDEPQDLSEARGSTHL